MDDRDDAKTNRSRARGQVHVLLPEEPPTLTPGAARALLRLVRNAAAAQEEAVAQYDEREAA